MLNALLNVANMVVKLVSKASSDPDVQALAQAVHDLIAAHNSSTPTPPPGA